MRQRIGLLGAVIVAVLSGFAVADPRPFTFNTDTYSMGKGEWEYEQWITFSGEAEDNASAKEFAFRHELEFGVADNVDLAIYFPQWAIAKDDDEWDTEFEGGAFEVIVYLSNPVTDFVGIGLYSEIGIAEDELEFEHKLLVQKDIGKWIFVYNFVIETEIEHVFDTDEESEVEGVLEHTFGATYAIADGWLLGGELIIASEYDDWTDYEGTTAYAGPAISYQGGQIGEDGGWWVTVTPTIQLTNKDAEPDLVARMLFGISF